MAKKAKKSYIKKGFVPYTIHLPKALHTKLKAKRSKTGKMMNEIVIAGLEKELKKAA